MVRLLSSKEVAARLGCHPETVRRAIRAGRIPARALNPAARRPTYLVSEDRLEQLFGSTETHAVVSVEPKFDATRAR